MIVFTNHELEKICNPATVLFWRDGFSKTSYERIVAATGISRKTLYANWSGKAALFNDCANYYMQNVIRPFFHDVSDRVTTPDQYDSIWDNFGQMRFQGEQFRGCLVFRAQIEGAGDQTHLRKVVGSYFDLMRESFETALEEVWRAASGPVGAAASDRALHAASIAAALQTMSVGDADVAVETLRELGRALRR